MRIRLVAGSQRCHDLVVIYAGSGLLGGWHLDRARFIRAGRAVWYCVRLSRNRGGGHDRCGGWLERGRGERGFKGLSTGQNNNGPAYQRAPAYREASALLAPDKPNSWPNMDPWPCCFIPQHKPGWPRGPGPAESDGKGHQTGSYHWTRLPRGQFIMKLQIIRCCSIVPLKSALLNKTLSLWCKIISYFSISLLISNLRFIYTQQLVIYTTAQLMRIWCQCNFLIYHMIYLCIVLEDIMTDVVRPDEGFYHFVRQGNT